MDDNGHVLNSGWARDDLFIYERSKIKSGPLRIKEWDYWEVFNDRYALILNIFDIGFAGVAQFSLNDFSAKKPKEIFLIKPLTRGSVGHPGTWKYDAPLVFEKKGNRMEFDRRGDDIILKVNFPKKEIFGEINLYKDPRMDTMTNLIPFHDPRQFVYAIKIMCMPATGTLRIGDRKYDFNASNNSWGILDWTRAVFPYRNQWKWCIASGKVDGVNFGFNIDYGFGRESNKSMIIYDGRGHHLKSAEYQHDWKNLHRSLPITSADGRVNLVLKPKKIEKTGANLGFLEMRGIKTYGYFTGEMVLDDGRKVEIKEADKLFGWAEEFFQKW